MNERIKNFDTNYEAFTRAEKARSVSSAPPHVQALYYHAVICSLLSTADPKDMERALAKAGERYAELGGAA